MKASWGKMQTVLSFPKQNIAAALVLCIALIILFVGTTSRVRYSHGATNVDNVFSPDDVDDFLHYNRSIWSKGWRELVKRYNPTVEDTYFDLDGGHRPISAENMMNLYRGAQGVVWISNAGQPPGYEVVRFAENVLSENLIRRNFVLITTDGDLSMPGGLRPSIVQTILNHPNVLRWYTQNYDGTVVHAKLRRVPIGLSLHDRHPGVSGPQGKLDIIRHAAENARPWPERESKILVDVLSKTHFVRKEIESMVLSNPRDHVHRMTQRIDLRAAMRHYASYKFAASPRGNGLDCHRTWELLLLGTVPIIQTSSLDPLFKALPVVIIKDWSEILDIANVKKWISQIERQRSLYSALNQSKAHDDFVTCTRFLV